MKRLTILPFLTLLVLVAFSTAACDRQQPPATITLLQNTGAATPSTIATAVATRTAAPTGTVSARPTPIPLTATIAGELDLEKSPDIVQDTAATPRDNDYQWSYHPRPLLAGATWPSERNPAAPLLLRFNYPVNEASFKQSVFIEPAIAGEFEWNQTKTVATFRPAAPWQSLTHYTVHFHSSLLDEAGDLLPPLAAIHFTTPPPILVTRPQGDRVDPVNIIEITFDRLVDEAKTAAALRIEPHTPGRVNWTETTLTFQADEGHLLPFTTYTVTLNSSAVDREGRPLLLEPRSWTFRTSSLNPVATFGWGPNAQLLDVNGRRAVHYNVRGAASVLTFELYRLNLEQFLDRYSSGFRGVAGWELAPISTAATTLAKRWDTNLVPSIHEWAYIQEVIIPDDVPAGLYILNLKSGFLNDQLLLVLTGNSLVVKQAEGQLTAWVTDINGEPAGALDVAVYARNGRLLDSGQADENGLFRAHVSVDPQPLMVVARSGDDITISGLSNEWRQGANPWGSWWRPQPIAAKYAAYIYTDRPIYRPGQKVFYKAIIRQDDDALLSILPEGTAVTVRIRDGRNNVLQTLTLTTNHFGTIQGEFQLAEGAGLGGYAIEIVTSGENIASGDNIAGGESHRQLFKVEEYQKPDFQVTVSSDADRYVSGGQIQVTIDSAYYFGEPVANAPVTLKLYHLGEPEWWWGEESDEKVVWYAAGEPRLNARTDANGRLTFSLPASTDSFYGRRLDWQNNLSQLTLAIEATIDDGSHQAVSGVKIVKIFNAAESVRLDTGGYVREPGQPFTIRADVRTITGSPVNGRSLTLQLQRYNVQSHAYDLVLQSANLGTGADGRAALPFTIDEPGYYRLHASGRDRLGNEISATTWIYAFSSASWSNWFGGSQKLAVVADRESYAPGDTARLIIESAFSGPALLTFERGTTRRAEMVRLTAPVTFIDVPIQPDDIPNIFVAVNAWEEQDTTLNAHNYQSIPDSNLHIATIELSVPASDRLLQVTITPDKESYAPREEAQITVRITNQAGLPVSAELSLAVVDEAIFALSEELAGPIYDGFYYHRAHIVRAYHSLAPVRYLGDSGRGGGGGDISPGNPRSDFPDTALWFPALHSDANGEVTVSLTLPDNLTRWRLTVKAVTADTQIGESVANIVTRQDVVVRPILPRGLTAGDEVTLTALVHNHSKGWQTLAVSLALLPESPLTVTSPLTQTVTLAAGAVRRVNWTAVAHSAGEGQLLLRADAGGRTLDAVRLPLTVRPLAMPDVTSQVGQFSGALLTTVELPSGALPMSSVRIELSRSIAGTLLEGLEYLTGFPYGCVEQTMSRALPNAVVGRAFHQLGVGNPSLQADLPPQINAGLQRLYGFQHDDGGWGWWFDDNSDAYQTAWVVFGLAVTAEAGYEVDPAVIARGAQWLRDNLSAMPKPLQAYSLYSLATAGHGDREATLALAAEAAELDYFSQAALALALHKSGLRPQARALVDGLAQTAATGADGRVFWSGSNGKGEYDYRMMASDTRATALVLSAFSQIQPNHELVPGAVRWLMSQRRQQGWGTTNETAYAIIGLTDHLLATSFSESAGATGYTVFLNGRAVASGNLGRGEPAVSLEIPAGEMVTGVNSLRIEQTGGGRLYYTLNNRVYLAQAEIDAAGPINVSRAYLDPDTNRPITTTVAGQLVKVQLTVQLAANAAYMIVEDHLPGGLEALNESLNTTSRASRATTEPHSYWRQLGYNYKEVRGGRVSFFITEMGSGRHTFTYLARATHSGAFVAMPAEAYAMYDLTTWGRSGSGLLWIKE
jgi:alpha-2-macroglobulin